MPFCHICVTKQEWTVARQVEKWLWELLKRLCKITQRSWKAAAARQISNHMSPLKEREEVPLCRRVGGHQQVLLSSLSHSRSSSTAMESPRHVWSQIPPCLHSLHPSHQDWHCQPCAQECKAEPTAQPLGASIGTVQDWFLRETDSSPKVPGTPSSCSQR